MKDPMGLNRNIWKRMVDWLTFKYLAVSDALGPAYAASKTRFLDYNRTKLRWEIDEYDKGLFFLITPWLAGTNTQVRVSRSTKQEVELLVYCAFHWILLVSDEDTEAKHIERIWQERVLANDMNGLHEEHKEMVQVMERMCRFARQFELDREQIEVPLTASSTAYPEAIVEIDPYASASHYHGLPQRDGKEEQP